MPGLEQYFQEAAETKYDHPVLRYLLEQQSRPEFHEANIEIRRNRTPLGEGPAKLYVHFLSKSGSEINPPVSEQWDDELNSALIQRGVRSIDVSNEVDRFSLALNAALEPAETRHGDGYFNAVLVHHIENSAFFTEYPAVAELMKHVYRSRIDTSFKSYLLCREMIDSAIRGRAQELTKNLGYGVVEAQEILAMAIARYLDNRFSVSNRRALGLL